MAVLIKRVRNRNLIEFDQGLFDKWCVFLTRPNQARYAPRDTEYFSMFHRMSVIYGADKVYSDFVSIYALTSATLENKILQLITEISDTYNSDCEEADIWFTVIYAGMVAEENKENAILKKRIKRLGMHQVLLENLAPEKAAIFSKGKNWRELDIIMKQRGF